MVKYGIISDTHITTDYDAKKLKTLIEQLKIAFKGVDEIIHAGDICDDSFLKELNKIAPTKCVAGETDTHFLQEKFLKFSLGNYNIGVIHDKPENLEAFYKQHNLHILIYGHSHQPTIVNTQFRTLLLNPGSPTFPKAPPKVKGFKDPIARPSVITLSIENDIVTTFIVNLNL